jgi:hypothetical protein
VEFSDAIAGIVGFSGGFNRVEGALQGNAGGRMEPFLRSLIFLVHGRTFQLLLILGGCPFGQVSRVERDKFNAFSFGYIPYGPIADANAFAT